MHRWVIGWVCVALAACGNASEPGGGGGATATESPATAARATGTGAQETGAGGSVTGTGAQETGAGGSATAPAPSSDDFPRGLLVALTHFPPRPDGTAGETPGPARLEILIRRGGQWRTEVIEDPGSNVFHKAMVYEPPGAAPGIVTLGGMAAAVKLWRRGPSGWTSETLWTEEFGGRVHRMRDAEIANLYGDGPSIAVGTHDQGVVAVIRPDRRVERLDRRPRTFVHEVEVGDLDGDGTLEIYTTPSDPNDLAAGAVQHGEVVRYVPREGSRTVVADLGNRHAKEIWVGDADGDGRDELYVAVEALTSGSGGSVQIVEPVEIRRYDAGTPPDARIVIATIRDRFTRFLTVGDVDGDGRREMVIASFSSGLWLARPGRDPRGEWAIENIDRDSGGWEHAALITDLDGDGRDELYVAADEQGEIRRYVWVDGRPRRQVLVSRQVPRSFMTWNLAPVPVALVAP
jgi:hypothetical protein